jgi:hypothetical protein
VGAPLGKNLQPGTNHSGALYRCPITTNVDDCEQVVTDGKRSKFVLAQLPGPPSCEDVPARSRSVKLFV